MNDFLGLCFSVRVCVGEGGCESVSVVRGMRIWKFQYTGNDKLICILHVCGISFKYNSTLMIYIQIFANFLL
jgi:YD repeat-containing protein